MWPDAENLGQALDRGEVGAPCLAGLEGADAGLPDAGLIGQRGLAEPHGLTELTEADTEWGHGVYDTTSRVLTLHYM